MEISDRAECVSRIEGAQHQPLHCQSSHARFGHAPTPKYQILTGDNWFTPPPGSGVPVGFHAVSLSESAHPPSEGNRNLNPTVLLSQSSEIINVPIYFRISPAYSGGRKDKRKLS